jgi:starvation-inducible DNA-binding protein
LVKFLAARVLDLIQYVKQKKLTTMNSISKVTLSNHLKLESEKMNKISDILNDLLSDYHIFYQNVRGFHWNLKGEKFFDLHEKLEELCLKLNENIDELSERIVAIGFKPIHSYSHFLNQTIHKEITDVCNGEESVRHVVDGLGVLSYSHREAANLAVKADDISSADLLIRFGNELEKRMWTFTMSSKN